MKVSFTLEDVSTKSFTNWLNERVKQLNDFPREGESSSSSKQLLELGFPDWGNPRTVWNRNLFAVRGRYLKPDEDDFKRYYDRVFIVFNFFFE